MIVATPIQSLQLLFEPPIWWVVLSKAAYINPFPFKPMYPYPPFSWMHRSSKRPVLCARLWASLELGVVWGWSNIGDGATRGA
jgi:hypothetical protein